MMIKRLYIHEKIYDRFRAAFIEYTASLKVGNGTEPSTFFGPVQNAMQYAKLKDLLSSINSEGLSVALGGTITESEGLYIHPTIVDDPPESSRIVQEEPFGPIIPLMRWSSEEDVIARANSTKTGLGASVWSKDLKRAGEIGKQLQAGSVWINSHFEVAPNVSIGGHKWSGIGSEWGVSGLISYCNLQTLWHKKR
jgi:acyl-CoA reductase-like NAD-dependent aldehyde dehydrogenase